MCNKSCLSIETNASIEASAFFFNINPAPFLICLQVCLQATLNKGLIEIIVIVVLAIFTPYI